MNHLSRRVFRLRMWWHRRRGRFTVKCAEYGCYHCADCGAPDHSWHHDDCPTARRYGIATWWTERQIRRLARQGSEWAQDCVRRGDFSREGLAQDGAEAVSA